MFATRIAGNVRPPRLWDVEDVADVCPVLLMSLTIFQLWTSFSANERFCSCCVRACVFAYFRRLLACCVAWMSVYMYIFVYLQFTYLHWALFRVLCACSSVYLHGYIRKALTRRECSYLWIMSAGTNKGCDSPNTEVFKCPCTHNKKNEEKNWQKA